MIFNSAHEFTFIEDSEIIEIKQGPFIESKNKIDQRYLLVDLSFIGKEQEYLNKCIEDAWIGPGEFNVKFEKKF